MRIHVVMFLGVPAEAWTDKLYAMRRSAEIGGSAVTVELRSENTPEDADHNADQDRKPRKAPAK